MSDRNILLIEPGYRNKYPPLGLMKLAAYHGPQGRDDRVTFVKGEDAHVFGQAWDRVYVTTLFSFEWNRTATAIDFALRAANGQPERVFVGGIGSAVHKGPAEWPACGIPSAKRRRRRLRGRRPPRDPN